ncbi:hypothetical protein [Streptomyces sp. NPDC014685]|uniref:hypothetical protein n=1 Tax=Streptomyces sp. NPDC014685 TaxID=3364881 RepID=UPI0036FF6D18
MLTAVGGVQGVEGGPAEGASEIRTGRSPENMATLHGFAVDSLRTVGRATVSAGHNLLNSAS